MEIKNDILKEIERFESNRNNKNADPLTMSQLESKPYVSNDHRKIEKLVKELGMALLFTHA